MPSCSKAPWGLSVQSRVTCIFTGTSISPSPSLRQCPNRYAFRAGRNLPDKEFRYLRTVIVTAAVYRGFNSELSHFLLTFRHRAGVSTYISAFAFAGTCVCAKQSLGPLLCHCLLLHLYKLHNLQSSLFRSYGCNLPSSLTRVFSRTLGFSPCLPVSVLVRVHNFLLEAFLGSLVHVTSTPPKVCLPVSSQPYELGICRQFSLPPSTRYSNSALTLPSASLHPITKLCSIGIFADCPSHTLLRLCLGPDLLRVDERCPENLRLSVFQFLTVIFATHTGILSSISSSCPSGQPSSKMERSPTDHCWSRRFSSVL